jgi:SecD/SecF fusion protein
VAERRNHFVLLGLILAALAGVAVLAIPGSPAHRKPVLGLDLQGGLEVVLKAVPPKGHVLTTEDIDRSISIMRNRIDKLGVTEPEIRKQGKDQIAIELAGVKDPKVAAALIGKTAVLEMYDFEVDVIGPSRDISGNPVPLPSLYRVLSANQTETLVKKDGASSWYLFDAKRKAIVGPMPTKQAVLQSERVKKRGGKIPKKFKLLAVPKKSVVVSWPVANGTPLGNPPSGAVSNTYFYLLKRSDDPNHPIPELTGKQLKLSAIRADFDQNNSPIVTLDFNGKGRKIFHEITRAEAHRGALAASTAGVGTSQVDLRYVQHFAIVLDGEIKSTPYIDYVENPDGISGGTGAQINIGNGGIGEAKDLALVLQTGSLPIKFDTAEQTVVSATLGKDSLREALRAAIVGLAIVAIFLLVLYRFLGLVAVFGLAIYAALMYAAILLFNVTLTLPGFAGLILTIGVAADANVVVFERIKEEVRAGKSVRAAIGAGYAKGFHTILDANVVTAITALVLFAVATAGVKGFALMLLIGTVISLVTAVAATRAMLGLLAGFRWFANPRFMGAQGQQTAKWLQVDFMRRKNLWFAISGVIILVGVVSLSTKHLNLGIDFKGGTQITFKTTKPHTVGEVRDVAAANGHERDAVIQARGAQITTDHYKNFQIRTKALSGNQLEKFGADLQDRVDATSLGKTTVSSSFGRQIAKSALLAILVSLLLIVAYIGIRFDLKFAGPVIAALIHDIVITVGVYSVTGREVTSATVAAVLTVLGYSIYDTIIIFDRIRENVPLMRRSAFATIANVSLWETIRRSLATTFITLLPVMALFLFGGATLKDFAFALIVGIASGAYSSIFIAAPLLTVWKEREPEYARRRGQVEAAAEGDGGVPTRRRQLRPRGVATVDSGTVALEEATHAAAAEPAPALGDLVPQPAGSAQAKRDARRQRRRTRPHGRAR